MIKGIKTFLKGFIAPQPTVSVNLDPLDELLEQKLQEAKGQKAALLLAQERQKKAALIEQISLEIAQANLAAVTSAMIESLAKAEITGEEIAAQQQAAQQMLADPAAAIQAKKLLLLAQQQQQQQNP
jgi:hypothetical protein